MDRFFGRGKLLLTGEYAVMDGALALALPVKLGQSLSVRSEPDSRRRIGWKSYSPDNAPWFEAELDKNFNVLYSDDRPKAEMLRKILISASLLNPEFLSKPVRYEITTHLDFNPEYGLGSSSTLIHNVSLWAEVDPYELLAATFGGSGYDIACAAASHPVFYQLQNAVPRVEQADFNPDFADELYFVYLNKKQNSREGIKHYRELNRADEAFIKKITELTRSISEANSLSEFEQLIEKHESLISSVLDLPDVKDRLFPDYPGSLKSLGARGGDFILATRRVAETYFPEKGFKTVFPFRALVKTDSKN